MAQYDFDLFTIGAGSGGVAASRRAGSYGARVAICESDRVGGTCVLRGCVPKKLLVYGAHFRHDFEDAAGYGWSRPRAGDWKKLQAAKDKELDRLNGVYKRLLRDSGVQLIEGRGRIVDPHTVEVAGKRYTAAHILVATGSRPFLPEVTGIEHAITSDGALNLPELPRRIAIVGGGYIGVEFAGIFNALGAKVTMLIRGDTVLRGFDDDVRAVLTQEMRKKGVDIRSEDVRPRHREARGRHREPAHAHGRHARGGRRALRHRPRAQHARARARGGGREAGRARGRRGGRGLPLLRGEHLRGGGRDGPPQPHARGHRRGPRAGRDALPRQPHAHGPLGRALRRVQPAAGGDGGAAASSRRGSSSARWTSTSPASGP